MIVKRNHTCYLILTTCLLLSIGMVWELDNKVETDTLLEYGMYLDNPDNGLIRERAISGVVYRVSYQLSDLLAYRDFCADDTEDASDLDSLMKSFKHTVAFQLQILPDSLIAEGDVMYKGISGYAGYAEGVRKLNFEMGNMIELQADSNVVKPVLCLAENTYSLTDGRKIMLVFSENDIKSFFASAKELQLVFNDELFGSGRQRFRFESEDILGLPNFPISDALKQARYH